MMEDNAPLPGFSELDDLAREHLRLASSDSNKATAPETLNMQEAFDLGMELIKIVEPHGPAVAITALSAALVGVARSVHPEDRGQRFRDLCAMMIEHYENVYAPRPGGLQ
jgi:hypothetical protein